MILRHGKSQYGIHTFRGRRFYGLRFGRFYLTVKDRRVYPAFYTERYRIGCRHVTIGNWRYGIRWNVPA